MSSFFASFRAPAEDNSVNSSAVESESDGSDFVQECVNGISVPTQTLPPPPSVELPELPELPPMPEILDTRNMKITELEEKLRELEEKNQMLNKSLDKMYDQERKDMDEIDYLKMNNDHLKERNTELYDDRNILRGVIKTLKNTIKMQNSQLDAWMDCYKKSWEDYDYQVEEEDEGWKPDEEQESETEEEVEEEKVEEKEVEAEARRKEKYEEAVSSWRAFHATTDSEEEVEESEQEQECELEYEHENGNLLPI